MLSEEQKKVMQERQNRRRARRGAGQGRHADCALCCVLWLNSTHTYTNQHEDHQAQPPASTHTSHFTSLHTPTLHRISTLLSSELVGSLHAQHP